MNHSPLTPEQWVSAPRRGTKWSPDATKTHAHGVTNSKDLAVVKGHTRPFKVGCCQHCEGCRVRQLSRLDAAAQLTMQMALCLL